METLAKLKGVRLSPLKARLVADQVRGLTVEKALNVLSFSTKRAARLIKKVLESAIANAEHNHGADIDELKIAEILVDGAGAYKRMMPRAKGRGDRILKPLSHIVIKVSDGKEGK